MGYILSKLIKHAYKSERFVSALIFGEQGVGKTTYALHIAHEVYGSWDEALRHLFFDPRDAIALIERAVNEGKRIPLIIMDDAGLWLSRTRWWEKHKVEFANFFDIIRSTCSAILFTTPADNLLKRITNEINIRVKIGYIDSNLYDTLKREFGIIADPNVYRVAKLYTFSLSPLFQPIIKKRGYDVFPLKYPEEIRREYEERRRRAVLKHLLKVKQALESENEIKTVKRNTAEQIIELLEKGYSKAEIARKLGISRQTVYYHLKKIGRA